MQKIVSFLLVAMMLVVVPQAYGSINCYICRGYNPDEPDNPVTNNKNCPQNDFRDSLVHTAAADVCQTQVQDITGGKEITVRDGYRVTKMTRSDGDYINYRGYICFTNKCNDQPVSAAPLSRALCLPLLLLSFLAAFHRCLD